jgi:uncharacterized membrane protein YhdT
VQFGTAAHRVSRYAGSMFSEKRKMLLFVGWAVAVCLVAIALGITSVSDWMVVACVALVPPFVARRFWHAPERTISESINDARR